MKALRLSRVYPITDTDNIHDLSHLDQVRRFAAGGAGLVQVREKALSDRHFYQELVEIREFSREAGIHLIINDRVDMVLAVGADGVHLGQDDLPPAVARRLLGKDAIIGVSTHNTGQFEQACRSEVDYIAVGPIFASPTKAAGRQPLGCQFLAQVHGRASVPIVAIGGITLQTAPDVWRSGAFSAAVVSDIVNSPDPTLRVVQYLKKAKETLQ